METPLPESAKCVVDRIRTLISSNNAEKKEKEPGLTWNYVGMEITKELDNLKNDRMLVPEGSRAVACHAYHVLRGANILNPTSRLLLIIVNGTPTLDKNFRLLQDKYYTLEQERPLFGQGDFITIVLEIRK
ncbi:hypothetical protein BDV59DRAFT_162604 [Aspergillus ambiguus]|uniref:uncharacterized protein n=1 Tax=Aspergillus ambiguus TaxID=176160 RepID=UPI003CCD8DEF